jgi:hypothetical protein
VYNLDLVAKTYARLQYERYSYFPVGTRGQFPKGARLLSDFIAGYLNHKYELVRSDFYNVDGADEAERATRPIERDVYSFVFIGERPKPNVLGKQEKRPVRIHLNVGTTNSGEPLNRCWRRFCCLKEVCQAVIYEEANRANDTAYPTTLLFPQLRMLFGKINNEPFSLWDFDDPDYDLAHRIENLAELLALGLLYPFEHALANQETLKAKFNNDVSQVDLYSIADQYKVPRRYVELMLTWTGLSEFVALVEQYSDRVD